MVQGQSQIFGSRTGLEIIKAWVQLSRPPFHLVGVFPFILGSVIAWRLNGVLSLEVFAVGLMAVVLIMLSTYYAGEYYDLKGDILSAQLERNMFSGGSQAIVQNKLPAHHSKIASYISLALAGVAGLLLQFYYGTGPWTIPLGMIGMFCGFFYSTPPFRWVKRGVGELMIGFCYGWLPVAVGYYIQRPEFHSLINLISIPICLSIFNVILINEFPDYPADVIEGKRNLVVRMGRDKARYLYVLSTMISWIGFYLALNKGLPKVAILFYLPVFSAGFYVTIAMLKGKYKEKTTLERMCGLTLFTNLGTCLAYILPLLFWGIGGEG